MSPYCLNDGTQDTCSVFEPPEALLSLDNEFTGLELSVWADQLLLELSLVPSTDVVGNLTIHIDLGLGVTNDFEIFRSSSMKSHGLLSASGECLLLATTPIGTNPPQLSWSNDTQSSHISRASSAQSVNMTADSKLEASLLLRIAPGSGYSRQVIGCGQIAFA